MQANEELNSFAVNKTEGLVWTCFFLPEFSLMADQIFYGERLCIIIVSKQVLFLVRFFDIVSLFYLFITIDIVKRPIAMP